MHVRGDSSAMQVKCAELGTCSAKVPLVLLKEKKVPLVVGEPESESAARVRLHRSIGIETLPLRTPSPRET